MITLTLNYSYRIYPDSKQEAMLDEVRFVLREIASKGL
ncbi:helix-turn-helix domain-containing protein [Crocosphaera sp.]